MGFNRAGGSVNALAWPVFVALSAVSLFFFHPVERVQEGSRRGSEG